MKTINVSEDALNTIKRMAEEREQKIEILRKILRAIRDIAQNQDIGVSWEDGKLWDKVEDLCNQALCG
jgi:restriction endonuclease S subunit